MPGQGRISQNPVDMIAKFAGDPTVRTASARAKNLRVMALVAAAMLTFAAACAFVFWESQRVEERPPDSCTGTVVYEPSADYARIAERTADATDIIVGRVEGQIGEDYSPVPTRTVRVLVEKSLYGSASSEIDVLQAGAHGCATNPEPLLEIGRTYLMYLSTDAATVTSPYQLLWYDTRSLAVVEIGRAKEAPESVPALRRPLEAIAQNRPQG